MSIRVLLFASLAEALGRDQLVVELAAPVSAGAVRDAVLAGVGDWVVRGPVRVAVNQLFVDDGAAVLEGDEVALIPPVAGG